MFDSYIAGTTHLDDKSVLEQIKIGDMLTLQRENNKFDSNAIHILNDEKKKLGYISREGQYNFCKADGCRKAFEGQGYKD